MNKQTLEGGLLWLGIGVFIAIWWLGAYFSIKLIKGLVF
jgi:hypothetical protein